MRGTLPGPRGGSRLRLQRSRVGRRRPWWLLLPVLALLGFLAWPYVSLWRLSAAASDPDPSALAPLVDLDAIRGEIRRKLNKTASSAIGKVSDPFIQWLERGILQLGTGALDQLVTLAWVQERLGANSPPGQGFLGRGRICLLRLRRGVRGPHRWARSGPGAPAPRPARLRLEAGGPVLLTRRAPEETPLPRPPATRHLSCCTISAFAW